jgi:hypothetical protein
MQTKGIDKLVNRIIAENFQILEKGRDIQVQETCRTMKPQEQKKIYHNQNTQYRE